MRIVDTDELAAWPFRDLFYSRAWLKALSETYGYAFKAVVDGEGVPRLLFSEIDDIFGKRVISLPFSDYTDPGPLGAEEILALAARIRQEAPGAPLTLKLLGDHDLSPAGFTRIRSALCHRISLTGEIEEIWQRTSHAFKKGVKKAQRSGVRFAIDNTPEGVDEFCRMLLKLRREKFHILPQPKAFYHALYRHFVMAGQGDLCFTYLDELPIAAAFVLRCGNALYDKMGVSDQAYLDLRPNNLLLWEVMQRGQAAGNDFLDMGLTQVDKEGLISFKESLGGVATPITYYRQLPDGHDQAREQHVKALMSQLTGFIVESATSDSQIEGAADILYRYFC